MGQDLARCRMRDGSSAARARPRAVGRLCRVPARRQPGQRDRAGRIERPGEPAPAGAALRAVAQTAANRRAHRRITEALGVAVLRLPSTSPANASWSFERKLEAWRAPSPSTASHEPPADAAADDARAAARPSCPNSAAFATCTSARPGCRARCGSASRRRSNSRCAAHAGLAAVAAGGRAAPEMPGPRCALQLGLGAATMTRFCNVTLGMPPPRSKSTGR